MLEKKNTSGEWVRVPDHPIETLLKYPNPFMSGQDLIERMIYSLNLGGNGLLHMIIVGAEGKKTPLELWPIRADTIKPVAHGKQFISKYEYRTPEQNRDIPVGEIVHLMFPDPANERWGMSPLMAAAKAVDTDVEAANWNKITLQNRAVIDTVFSFNAAMSRDQFLEARAQVQAQATGVDRARVPWVVGGDKGASVHRLSLSPVEMDFMGSRVFNKSEIAAAFGVPTILIGGDQEAKYDNLDGAKRLLWEDAIAPLLEDICEGLNARVVPYWDAEGTRKRSPTLRIRPDYSGVTALQSSFSDRVKNAAELADAGFPLDQINDRLGLGFTNIPAGSLKPRVSNVQKVGDSVE